jgi:cullin 1
VPVLIAFKKKMDEVVEKYCDNNIIFQDSKNKAFSSFMNKDLYSRMLAYYSDFELRTGIKGLKEKEAEDRLNDIINLYKCINSKLIFQQEYQKKMSDRLIQGKSQSLISEKNFVAKLKAESGVAYVSSMTTMLQDLDSNVVLMTGFKSLPHKGSPGGLPFNVQVLQNAAWIIDRSRHFPLPLRPILDEGIEAFKNYYLQKHKTHKLNWYYGLVHIL